MPSDFDNLPRHIRAQVEAQGQTLAQNEVQAAGDAQPGQSYSDQQGQTQDVSQLPDHAQDQVAAQGEALAQNDVQAAGTVSQESGAPTDWNQKPGGDVPEPSHVEQEPTQDQSMTQQQ